MPGKFIRLAAAMSILAAFVVHCHSARAAAAEAASAPPAAKAKVAVFPLAGTAAEELREKVAFALRKKLDRDGAYEVIDGYAMKDLAGGAPVPLGSAAGGVAKLVAGEGVSVLIWGELAGGSGASLAGSTLKLKVLDVRQKDATPRDVTKKIDDPTDLRFVAEEILAAMPGVKGFEHPNEQAVKDDATSKELWAKNPNLVANGDFSDGGAWDGIYMAEKYRLKMTESLPAVDKISIYPMPAEGSAKPNAVLAMNLSREAAENNGLACLSDPIRIKPNARYRISFRYKSQGPSTHVFVKGYTAGQDLKGAKAEREIFRTQVPPTGPTAGKWETVVCDVNPYHPAFPVQQLRVDLYAYLSPGVILWDDVIVKEIGPLTDKPADSAIKPPAARPAGAK